MTTDDEHPLWIVIFLCACPTCEHPRVDHEILEFKPSERSIDAYKLALLECERCHEQFRPFAPKCEQMVFEATQKAIWKQKVS
jgi:hypothetical protein